MRKLTYILFLFFISCNSEKEITLNELYGTYEHVYTDWDNEENFKWDGVKNVVILKENNAFEHLIYIRDSLIIHEFGAYTFKYHPKWSSVDMIGGYTEFVKYVSVKPERVEKFRFYPKRNIGGNIYLIIQLPMDPDGAPADPKYKKIK